MDKKHTAAGSLKISNDVVVRIASLAAMEIDGVSVKGQKLDTADAPPIAEHFITPVTARLTGEAAVIDISIVVVGGHKAVRVAEAVQHSVKSAVQNMTGIAVSKVNVRITGVRITEIPEPLAE